MDSHEVFERNLECLRERDSSLAEALETGPFDEIETVTGPRGDLVLRDRGVLLGSAYDPAREATRLAEKMAENPADLMVAIGFGLGEQFEPYSELNPGTVVVFEPSLSRLRAALHRRSFTGLLAKGRDFHVTTEFDRFSMLIDACYSAGLRIQVFTHPSVLRLDSAAVNRAVERVRRVKESVDTRGHTNIRQMIPWARMVAQNGSRIAATPGFGELERRFEGRAAVIVAAGPSLDKQLPLLAQYQDRVLIIAIGQTVKALAEAGIRPHLVHLLESQDVSHQLREAPDASQLNVAVTPDCHPAVFDVEVASTFVATPKLSPMGTWIGKARGDTRFTLGGGTVAQGAVGLAEMLGADPILLIGQDLAFTHGRAYAKNSSYGFIGVDVSEEGVCRFTHQKEKLSKLSDLAAAEVDELSPAKSLVWVEGWEEGERVATWPAYASFIENYRDIGLHLARRGVRLINCTEGGARITGLEHLRFGETLERYATDVFDPEEQIRAAYEGAPIHTARDFIEPLRLSRSALSRLETVTRKASRFVAKQREKSNPSRTDREALALLERLNRFERKVKRRLGEISWFDALVQPELHRVFVAFRRTERQNATVEHLLEETGFLFDTVLVGIARARTWFDEFEASFESIEPKEPKTLPSEPGRVRTLPPSQGAASFARTGGA